MADFDQAQQELSSFLDEQFSTVPVASAEEDKKVDDEEISEYLTADEEVPVEVPAQQTQPETPAPQAPSDFESRLALERELAATRAREEIYRNAITQQQQQQAHQQPEQTQYVPFADDELAVSEEHTNLYHDADPYIASIARRVANDLYQRTVVPLQQELYNVQGQLQAQQQFNVQQTSFSQHAQLKSLFPDFDDIVRSNEWKGFLAQEDVYGTGARMIDYVQQGIATNNVRQLAGLVNQFKAQQQRGKPQQQQVAPGRAQTSIPNTAVSRGGKILKMSDFERATANFQAGRLSYDKYQVITDEFNAAMLDGRVNLNK